MVTQQLFYSLDWKSPQNPWIWTPQTLIPLWYHITYITLNSSYLSLTANICYLSFKPTSSTLLAPCSSIVQPVDKTNLMSSFVLEYLLFFAVVPFLWIHNSFKWEGNVPMSIQIHMTSKFPWFCFFQRCQNAISCNYHHLAGDTSTRLSDPLNPSCNHSINFFANWFSLLLVLEGI